MELNKAFWIYACLVETILPVDFFIDQSYQRALSVFVETILLECDKTYFTQFKDSFKSFCDKSFGCLFTNIIENQEIAFSILDLLFLYGNPIVSETLLDDDKQLIKTNFNLF